MDDRPEGPTARRRTWRGGCLRVGCIGLPTISLLLIVLYLFNNRQPDIVIPTPPMLTVNAYDDFVRAEKIAHAVRHLPPFYLPGLPTKTQTLANLAAWAKDAGPVLALFHQALDKPYRFPSRRSLTDPGSVLTPLRHVVTVIEQAADYYALTGQAGRAADIRLDGMEFGAEMPTGGGIMSVLGGSVTVMWISAEGFEPLIPKLSAAELAHAAARLDRVASRFPPYADIVTEEGWENTAMWLQTFRNPNTQHYDGYYAMLRDLAGAKVDQPLTFSQGMAMIRLTFANKTAMLKQNLASYAAFAAEARAPFTTASHVPIPNNPLAAYMQFVHQTREFYEDDRAVIELLRAEVALYRYRAAHGRYPASLSALVPAYLSVVPNDPFGGGVNRPLRYRLRPGGKGFLLYSLGSDMKDDGGTPKQIPTAEGKGDIVAEHLFKPRKIVYP